MCCTATCCIRRFVTWWESDLLSVSISLPQVTKWLLLCVLIPNRYTIKLKLNYKHHCSMFDMGIVRLWDSLSLSRLFQQHKSLTEIVPALTPTRKSFREVVVEQNSGGMEQIYNSKNFVKNYTSKNFPPSFINICFTFHALNISA